MKSFRLLNAVLVLIGGAIIFLGLNVGLGGMRTLGWQASRDFITIADMQTFLTQDNHIRFIGGVWCGVGVLFLAGAWMLDRLRPTLVVLCGLIAFAGLFRLSAMDAQTILSAAILPSLMAELFGFPLLGFWLVRAGSRTS